VSPPVGCHHLHPPSPLFCYCYWYCFTLPRRVEGWVDLGGMFHGWMESVAPNRALPQHPRCVYTAPRSSTLRPFPLPTNPGCASVLFVTLNSWFDTDAAHAEAGRHPSGCREVDIAWSNSSLVQCRCSADNQCSSRDQDTHHCRWHASLTQDAPLYVRHVLAMVQQIYNSKVFCCLWVRSSRLPPHIW